MAISDGVSSSDSKEVVRLFYRAIIAGDLKQVVAMLHPDIEVEVTPHVPWGGSYRGTDEFLACVPKMSSAVDREALDILYIYGEGEHVFAMLRGRTLRGDPLLVGEDLVVKDGKIHRLHVLHHDARAIGLPLDIG